jgi:hypothetical protein
LNSFSLLEGFGDCSKNYMTTITPNVSALGQKHFAPEQQRMQKLIEAFDLVPKRWARVASGFPWSRWGG